MKDTIYNHYIAIDWSIENMAIARMTKKSSKESRPKGPGFDSPPEGA